MLWMNFDEFFQFSMVCGLWVVILFTVISLISFAVDVFFSINDKRKWEQNEWDTH